MQKTVALLTALLEDSISLHRPIALPTLFPAWLTNVRRNDCATSHTRQPTSTKLIICFRSQSSIAYWYILLVPIFKCYVSVIVNF